MLKIITSKKKNALETAKKWPDKRQKSQKCTRTCYNVYNCKSMWDTGACVSVSCNTTGQQDKITARCC